LLAAGRPSMCRSAGSQRGLPATICLNSRAGLLYPVAPQGVCARAIARSSRSVAPLCSRKTLASSANSFMVPTALGLLVFATSRCAIAATSRSTNSWSMPCRLSTRATAGPSRSGSGAAGASGMSTVTSVRSSMSNASGACTTAPSHTNRPRRSKSDAFRSPAAGSVDPQSCRAMKSEHRRSRCAQPMTAIERIALCFRTVACGRKSAMAFRQRSRNRRRDCRRPPTHPLPVSSNG